MNVVAGESDAGKSSLIHALEYCLFNSIMEKNPKWEVYKSWFPNTIKTQVVCEFDDATIIRTHTSSSNAYKINDERPLDPVGKDLPAQVFEATRMGRINFQNQHDKYFLIQASAGAVASYFNELVGLEKIDHLTDGVASVLRTTRTQLQESKEDEKKLKQDLQKYDFLDEVQPLLDQAILLEQELTVSTAELEQLTRLEQEHTNKEWMLSEVVDWLTVKPLWQEARTLSAEIQTASTQLARLENLEANFDRQIASLAGFNALVGAKGRVVGLNALVDQLDGLNDVLQKLVRLAASYDNLSTRLQTAVAKKDRLRAEYEFVIRTTGVCPTCGSAITEEVCQHIWSRV